MAFHSLETLALLPRADAPQKRVRLPRASPIPACVASGAPHCHRCLSVFFPVPLSSAESGTHLPPVGNRALLTDGLARFCPTRRNGYVSHHPGIFEISVAQKRVRTEALLACRFAAETGTGPVPGPNAGVRRGEIDAETGTGRVQPAFVMDIRCVYSLSWQRRCIMGVRSDRSKQSPGCARRIGYA